jgi:hypothetical protein
MVRSTTRTTDFPDIDHRQKTTQPPKGYYILVFTHERDRGRASR